MADDDYTSAIKLMPGAGRIFRRGYTARRRGTTYRVPGKYITDRGAKGKWTSKTGLRGIGPLRKGDLTSLGYRHTLRASQRHAAITRAVQKYGRNSTLRKLNAIAVYSKRTAPSRSKVYKTDVHYVQKKYD